MSSCRLPTVRALALAGLKRDSGSFDSTSSAGYSEEQPLQNLCSGNRARSPAGLPPSPGGAVKLRELHLFFREEPERTDTLYLGNKAE